MTAETNLEVTMLGINDLEGVRKGRIVPESSKLKTKDKGPRIEFNFSRRSNSCEKNRTKSQKSERSFTGLSLYGDME